MTRAEMTDALKIAKSDRSLANVDTSIMYGYGLPDFQPAHVTLEQVAANIRWQAGRLDGTWDVQEINNIANLGRKRFMIIG